jgi:hypothetical protein
MRGGDLDHVFEIFGRNSSSPGITGQEFVRTFGDPLATDISRYGRGGRRSSMFPFIFVFQMYLKKNNFFFIFSLNKHFLLVLNHFI